MSRSGAVGYHSPVLLKLAAVLLTVASWPQPVGSNGLLQSRAEPVDLPAAGGAITKAAAPGATHSFLVQLAPGDFLEISATQDEVALGLAVRDATGSVLHSIDLPEIRPLAERLLLVAPEGGQYAIEVNLGDDEVPEHRYVLRVESLRPATPEDRQRARLFEVLQRADALARSQTMDGLRKAVPLFQEAARGWRAAGDEHLESSTLEALAMLTSFFSSLRRESAAARERLVELYPRTATESVQARNFELLSLEYHEDGRLVEARDAALQCLDVAQRASLPLARCQREVARREFHLGNYQRAREMAQSALTRAIAEGDTRVEAWASGDLGRLDALAGDLDSAVARQLRAVDLAGTDRQGRAFLTVYLGFTHLQRGELDLAQARFEDRLKQSRLLIERDGESNARIGLGDVAVARGDRETARKWYAEAAKAMQNGSQVIRCEAEGRLAQLDLAEANLTQARERLQLMLAIAGDHTPSCQVDARNGLADLAAREGNLDQAIAEVERAIRLTDEFRHAAVSLESRAVGFGALAPVYERAIEFSMRKGRAGDAAPTARALEFNEQMLARGLLDRVSEERLELSSRAPASLVRQWRQARERWRGSLSKLQVAVRDRPNAPPSRTLFEETRELAVQVGDLEAQIDAIDPRRSSLVKPRALALADIQQQLDDETILLEYMLGEVHSYLWAISRNEIRAYTLPARETLEALAARVRAQFGRSPALGGGDAATDAAELSRLVLGPAASLTTASRLVVVPSGALALVPFAALPQPWDPRRTAMIERFEIVQVPSATVLAGMRRAIAARAPPQKTAVVFADPVFDGHDPRVRQTRAVRPPPPTPTSNLQSLRAAGLSLNRLPFSRQEAREIAAVAPGTARLFLGFDARREQATDRALFGYRFIHFATHALVNQEVPNLSSLVLSLVDESGAKRDGLVMLPDVYGMTLNADLVVLSACQTALGKQVQGEGALGLARGFMYAGVPRVIASLWQVDDLATAELMRRFYRGMIVDQLTAAAALRRAQIELARQPRWAAPFFWSAFILQGDWR